MDRAGGRTGEEGQLCGCSRPECSRHKAVLLGKQLLGLHYLSLGQRGWSGESHCWAAYGNLINLFTTAPTGLLSQAFCLLLTTGAPGVSVRLAELELGCPLPPPNYWALPLPLPVRANPSYCNRRGEGGATRGTEDWSPATALHPPLRNLCPKSRPESSP